MSTNFRSAELPEPRIFGGGGGPGLHTPLGIVPQPHSSMQPPPALPPRPFGVAGFQQQPQMMSAVGPFGTSGMFGGGVGGMNSMMGYGGGYGGYGGGGGYGVGGYGSYGAGYGGGGYGGGGYGSYGGGYGARYAGVGTAGAGHMDAEARFIQLAEESSRPAFQSIESLVAAIGNIAAMLDSTFFAITSSFRAVLGVAANFGRLRGVFAQFWSTFALFRGLSWLYKKLLFWMRLSNVDPSLLAMGEAFAAAAHGGGGVGAAGMGAAAEALRRAEAMPQGLSAWPVMVFLGFIFAGPYLIMKLIGSVSQQAIEESRNPRSWVNPIPARVQHPFQATSPLELTIQPGQTVFIAPREVQNTHKLLNTGWLLASLDNVTSGMIPVNYIEHPSQKSAWSEPTIGSAPPMPTMQMPQPMPSCSTTSSLEVAAERSSMASAEPIVAANQINELSSLQPPFVCSEAGSKIDASDAVDDRWSDDVKHTVSA